METCISKCQTYLEQFYMGLTAFTIYDLENDKGRCAMVEYIDSIVKYLTALERSDSNPC